MLMATVCNALMKKQGGGKENNITLKNYSNSFSTSESHTLPASNFPQFKVVF